MWAIQWCNGLCFTTSKQEGRGFWVVGFTVLSLHALPLSVWVLWLPPKVKNIHLKQELLNLSVNVNGCSSLVHSLQWATAGCNPLHAAKFSSSAINPLFCRRRIGLMCSFLDLQRPRYCQGAHVDALVHILNNKM